MEKDKIRGEIQAMTEREIFNKKEYKHIIQGRYSRDQCKSSEVIDQIVESEFHVRANTDGKLKDRMEAEFKSLAKSINKTSRKFDLDSKGKKSNFDALVYEGVIQKTLEADTLTFV